MKIVYDNLIFSWQPCGGISVVWANLLNRMLKKDAEVSILEYEGAEANNIMRRCVSIPERMITRLPARGFKLKRYMNPSPSLVDSQEKFIFHSSYYRTMNQPQAINITTVHDFAYELFETNKMAKFIHCWQKHRAIRRSDYVVCISENTRKDLLRLLPDVAPEKVLVINNGCDEKFFRMPDAQPKDYGLFIGKRRNYKNFDALIEPLAQLHLHLKIVGPPLTANEVNRIEAAGLSYDYHGTITDEELNKLYNEAFCLFYPSLYEGFGLPVIEAQQAGCPVIALNASAIPEVIGDRRMLIEQVTKEAIEEKINTLKDPVLRLDIIETGFKNAKNFSWDKMSDEYYKLYAKALKQ